MITYNFVMAVDSLSHAKEALATKSPATKSRSITSESASPSREFSVAFFINSFFVPYVPLLWLHLFCGLVWGLIGTSVDFVHRGFVDLFLWQTELLWRLERMVAALDGIDLRGGPRSLMKG